MIRIAHLTDCHVTADGELLADRVDTLPTLHRAIDRIEALDPPADVVVATGDLVNDGTPAEYDRLVPALGRLTAPLVVCPGNHDDRMLLRTHYPHLPAGGPGDPLDHVIDLDVRGVALRIVVLDTTVPGSHGGHLDDTQLAWLDRCLGEAVDRPVIVAQHHPPFESGIVWMDDSALVNHAAERSVLGGHDHVVAVLAGHFHRPMVVPVAGTIAWCGLTSAALIDLDTPDVAYTDEPPGFTLHEFVPHELDARGELRSHVVPVPSTPAASWRPSWSL